jgi:hypothetical protein
MYDIVFYYTQGYPELEIEKVKAKFPSAYFVQLGSDRNFVMSAKRALKDIKTSMFWLIPIEIDIDKFILKYRVPAWDTGYVHYEKIGTLDLFLIPKLHNFTDDQFEKKFFNDVKFIEFGIFSRCVYDVFFLSYHELNAETNYKKITKKYPFVKRIKDVPGIFNAHLEAAKNSSTNFMWIVDADADVIDEFNFNYEVPPWDFDVTHIWQSKNPVNGLVYGNGGVKLIPKHLILNSAEQGIVDVTTSLGTNIKVIEEISNYNNFAVDEFSTWRSAFRECVKLSARIIRGQVDSETDDRLRTWCTIATDTPYAKWAISGANAGRIYGQKNASDLEALGKINDFDWLRNQFETSSEAIGKTLAMTSAQANATS